MGYSGSNDQLNPNGCAAVLSGGSLGQDSCVLRGEAVSRPEVRNSYFGH